MQQAGGDGDRIHLHVGQYQARLQRVHQIRLAGSAGLSGVMFLGKFIRFLDDFEVVIGTIAAHPLHQLTEFCDGESGGRNLLA